MFISPSPGATPQSATRSVTPRHTNVAMPVLFAIVVTAAGTLFTTSARAYGSGGLPPLPPLPAAPQVAAPSLGNPGELSPEIAAWNSAFQARAAEYINTASQGLGASSARSDFAAKWAQAEQQAQSAATGLPTPNLPAMSTIQGELPTLDVTKLPPLPSIPTTGLPVLQPTSGSQLSATLQSTFGAFPAQPTQYAVSVNPTYSPSQLLAQIGGGCQPGGTGCPFAANPASMLSAALDSVALPSSISSVIGKTSTSIKQANSNHATASKSLAAIGKVAFTYPKPSALGTVVAGAGVLAGGALGGILGGAGEEALGGAAAADLPSGFTLSSSGLIIPK